MNLKYNELTIVVISFKSNENVKNLLSLIRNSVNIIIVENSNDHSLKEYYSKDNNIKFISKDNIGFSVIDTSTGEFYTGECQKNQLFEMLSKYNPSEIVLPSSTVYNNQDWYISLNPHVTTLDDYHFNYDNSYRALIDHFEVSSLKGFGCENFSNGVIASGGLFLHLKNNLSLSVGHLKKISPVDSDGIMGLDGYTIKNLEIFTSISSPNNKGTLINSIDSTMTSGGGRLLIKWLSRPLADQKKIQERQNVVET